MFYASAGKVINEVKKVVIGKDECIEKMMIAILAKGHILIEDIPGVGKTTLALAFSKAMDLDQHRIQFTPDVLPADITGFNIYQKETNEYLYQPGAILCNLFLADEINRTSPKTQSALLEVMEEGKVTVDSVTREVPQPFVVVATQNPMGSAGTQSLPDSQLDRFMICMSMGYPDIAQEIEIVRGRSNQNPMDFVEPVITKKEVLVMQKEVEGIFVHDVIYEYIGQIVAQTRRHPMLKMGVSPRGTLSITKMAKATAYLRGREYTIPEDVAFILKDVVCHRMHLSSKARVNNVTIDGVVEDIVDSITVPSPKKKRG